MNVYYTGIGSRKTPEDVLKTFWNKGKILSTVYDFTLRSGHAHGSDEAFEQGCDRFNGSKEIYIPWKRFNGSDSDLIVELPEAFKTAEKYHPYWHNLSNGAKKLQARNVHQVLGLDLKTPSSFVLCWTKNGKGGGGTGQAIRIAKAYGIPVLDAGKYDDLVDFCDDVIRYAEKTTASNQ